MSFPVAAAIAASALSFGALASGASVAAAGARPVGDAPSLRPAVNARAAAVDRCSYQVVRSDDSRYVYSVSRVGAGGTRELKIQAEDYVRVSGDWRKATQVDVCGGGQEQAPTVLRVTGKLQNPEGYDPSIPRTIQSDTLKPAAASVIPKAPPMTSVDRLDAATIRVTWKSAADNLDQVSLMERKPLYSSEVGVWVPYTYQWDVQAGVTSMNRKLERDADIPPSVRTHAYWIRVIKDGFVSDLRADKPLTIEP
ncbi:hypothetical protein EST92_30215 [Streptomyces sp. TM32]|uniref:hypothetical protein n=1 Tax=Streptomyces sp. TM32 TaxID=1652669 RepID=UPI0010129C07|nr:hypothetical protein [Streptomyces sp. TM32]RXS65042.1 hypothetical protein EST92_30215 [Streptomyces sp. TM32]